MSVAYTCTLPSSFYGRQNLDSFLDNLPEISSIGCHTGVTTAAHAQILRLDVRVLVVHRLRRNSGIFVIIESNWDVFNDTGDAISTPSRGADASALEVIDFLNTETPSDSVIETYDPELFSSEATLPLPT